MKTKDFFVVWLLLFSAAVPLRAWPMESEGENSKSQQSSEQQSRLTTGEQADAAREGPDQDDQNTLIARSTTFIAFSENEEIPIDATANAFDVSGALLDQKETEDDEAIESGAVQASAKIFPSVFMEGGYLFPRRGGIIYHGRRYTEHALERMAPETPEIIEELQRRAVQRAKAEGLIPDTDEYNTWLTEHAPQPRGVLPEMVEAEIANPGTTDLNVITSEKGAVITVIRTKQRRGKQIMDCLNRILIRKRKTQLAQKLKTDSNFFSLAQTTVGKQLLSSVRKQREKEVSGFSSHEDTRPFCEGMNSQLREVFNEIRKKQAARKLKMRHALQDVQRTFQRVGKINRDGLLDNWKWHLKAINEKVYQAAIKLNSSQLLQIVLENFKKKRGEIFQRIRNIISSHSDNPKKISDNLSSEKKSVIIIEAAQAAKKEATSAAEISTWDHVLVVSKVANDCSMEAAKMRGVGYDDALAAQWLEAARKYERTACESAQAATAYAAGNVNEGKSWVIASWQTHESADRAANKARAAQLDAPSSSHENQAPPVVILKEKEIGKLESAFAQEQGSEAQEIASSKINKADKKRIRASKKLEATALSYAAIWSQTASDYSTKEAESRSAGNERITARWLEAFENSKKVAEEYTKAAQLYADGKINEGSNSWHDARFTSNTVKDAADSAAELQREEKIERRSDAAVIFPKTTSEYCLKLQEAEAANNSELINKWREVVDKSQQGEEAHRRAAAIYAAGNKKEAQPLFASARAAEKEAALLAIGATFIAKLHEVKTSGDSMLTNHWSRVVQQYRLAEEDSAAALVTGNKEESSLWMNAANSGRRTAHTAAKQMDCLMKQHKALIAGCKAASILWGEAAEKNQKASEASQQAAEIWRAPKKGNEKWREQIRKKKGERADDIAQSMEKEANATFRNAVAAEAKEEFGVQVEAGKIEEKTSISKFQSLTRIFHTHRDEKVAKSDEARRTKDFDAEGCRAHSNCRTNSSPTQHSSGFPAFTVDGDEISGLSKAGGSAQKLSATFQSQVDRVNGAPKKKANSAKKKTTVTAAAKRKKEKGEV